MNKVTLWHKIIRNNEGKITDTSFNHIDNGWKEEGKPLPKSKIYTNQISWEKDEWLKEFKYISDNYVIINNFKAGDLEFATH